MSSDLSFESLSDGKTVLRRLAVPPSSDADARCGNCHLTTGQGSKDTLLARIDARVEWKSGAVPATEFVVNRPRWEVVIVGAGPAGLSAALTLGRCGRSVLLCDMGTPRSWASKEMHGFLTRDGIDPRKFRQLAHKELRRYKNVVSHRGEVVSAQRDPDGMLRVRLQYRRPVRCRKLLIATGVFDELPPIPGIDRFFGKSVFQCPYCDGWELRGEPVAVYGKQKRGFEMARAMTAWSDDIALCTNGQSRLSRKARAHLTRNGIRLYEDRIEQLEGRDGLLRAVVFAGGRKLPRTALFFDTRTYAQSKLAKSLGCQFTRHGGVKCGQYEATSVPGVFVAGNIIKDVQLAIVAAAEGTRAAFGINKTLTREDFAANATGSRQVQHPATQSKSMQRRRKSRNPT